MQSLVGRVHLRRDPRAFRAHGRIGAPPHHLFERAVQRDGEPSVAQRLAEAARQMPAHHRQWFVDAGIAGGGALIDHTVHLADLYRRLLRTEPVEVYARANRILHRDAVQVETGGFLMLGFPDGCFASLDFSWSRPAHYPSWGGLSLELVSDAGVIDMDAFRQKFDIYGAREQHYRTDFWGSDINALMIDEFIDAVRSKREPRVNIRDAVEALRVVDGAYRSLESGRPCAIP